MLEKTIEGELASEVMYRLRGEIRKLEWKGRKSAPDRIIFYKGAHFVETKAPGGKPRLDQQREHAKLKRHGVTVHVISTPEQLESFIKYLEAL